MSLRGGGSCRRSNLKRFGTAFDAPLLVFLFSAGAGVWIAGQSAGLIGCDANGDVWATRNAVGLDDLIPALKPIWSRPELLPDHTGQAGSVTLIADDSKLYAMWSQSAARSTDGGQTWSAPIKVAEGAVDWPRVVVAGSTGRVDLIWNQARGPSGSAASSIEVWSQSSPDGGQRWTEAARVAMTAVTQPADQGQFQGLLPLAIGGGLAMALALGVIIARVVWQQSR